MRFVTMLAAATCVLMPAGAAVAAPVAAAPASTALTAPDTPVGEPGSGPLRTHPRTAPGGHALAPETVARYGFDAAAPGAALADQSGRGVPLRVRAADGGVLRFVQHGNGRAVAFPARCATANGRCGRAILEGGDDADLDPGTRAFRYSARVLATAAQVGNGANIVQKGVATTESQWKMQINRRGYPNCVLVGRGSTAIYLARAQVRVTDGRWHQITCQRTADTLTVSVDNVSRGSVPVPAGVDVGNSLPLRIGGRNLNARTDQFGGVIDDVEVALN